MKDNVIGIANQCNYCHCIDAGSTVICLYERAVVDTVEKLIFNFYYLQRFLKNKI